MSEMKIDFEQFQNAVNKFNRFHKNFDLFARNFLLKEALKVLANTKMRTPVDTGDLRNRWELSDVQRTPNGYRVFIFNTLYYASYIEDGHGQQVGRFVPGIISGGRFVYKKGARGGIVLKKPFVNGFHMCRISLNEYEVNVQSNFDKAFKLFLQSEGI